MRAERRDNRAIVFLTDSEVFVTQTQGLKTRVTGPLQAGGVRAIRDDDGDGRVETSVVNRVDDRLKVGAASRDENAETASAAI